MTSQKLGGKDHPTVSATRDLLPFHTAAFTWHVDTFRLPQGSGRMESSGHTEPPFQSTVTHRGVGFKSWLNHEIVLLRKVLGFITKFS